MAKQSESRKYVLEIQCSSAVLQAVESKQRNRDVLLKLLRSTYFLAKNRIPHTTVYRRLLDLQVANGDTVLDQHMTENPLNTQYTSKFSVTMLIEAIDTWLERNLLTSLKSSTFFSVLADESQDICTQEELSICFRWIVNGCPGEHFLTVLHVKSTDAKTITDNLTAFFSGKKLDYRRVVGQGYDGAATFAGNRIGVQTRMKMYAAHAFYIHCSCHILQLTSIKAADAVGTIKRVLRTMTCLWKMFYYSPKKQKL